MRAPALILLSSTLLFTGCAGGGTSPSTPATGNGSGQASLADSAISAANALGTPVKSIADFNSGVSAQGTGNAISVSTRNLGTCKNGIEFFAPDKNNDANSTETQYFYDSACTALARDSVRTYTINGSTETLNRTTKIFALNNSTPSAVRTDATTIGNATFDQYGAPISADGFQRSSTGNLSIAGSRTIDSDEELVMQPASSGTSAFCSDTAGFNATGIVALNETFGWQGAVGAGTRTVNSDGSVTWTTAHAGSLFKGAIGSLSIGIGSPNSTCPISTPEYTLAGGTQAGTYSMPVSATYAGGWLKSLTVTNATLANGNTLNVITSATLPPTSAGFITATVSNGSTQIATFTVDGFGDGSVTVTSSGAQYTITDWHVVK